MHSHPQENQTQTLLRRFAVGQTAPTKRQINAPLSNSKKQYFSYCEHTTELNISAVRGSSGIYKNVDKPAFSSQQQTGLALQLLGLLAQQHQLLGLLSHKHQTQQLIKGEMASSVLNRSVFDVHLDFCH